LIGGGEVGEYGEAESIQREGVSLEEQSESIVLLEMGERNQLAFSLDCEREKVEELLEYGCLRRRAQTFGDCEVEKILPFLRGESILESHLGSVKVDEQFSAVLVNGT
jgi:hypothetical protein